MLCRTTWGEILGLVRRQRDRGKCEQKSLFWFPQVLGKLALGHRDWLWMIRAGTVAVSVRAQQRRWLV